MADDFTYKAKVALSSGEAKVEVIATTPHCRIELNLNPNKLELGYKDYEKLMEFLAATFAAVKFYKKDVNSGS